MKKVILVSLLVGVTSYLSAEIKEVYFMPINTKSGVFYIKGSDFGKDYIKIIEREGLEAYTVKNGESFNKLEGIRIKCSDESGKKCGYNLIKDYIREHNKNIKLREEEKTFYKKGPIDKSDFSFLRMYQGFLE